MQSVTISENTLRQLGQAAMLRGMDINAYAEELLAISLAAVREAAPAVRKTRRAMEFSAAQPTGRTASEIDAELEEGRGEWPEEPSESLPL